jgi:hypothetical protein
MDDASAASRRFKEVHEIALKAGYIALGCEASSNLAACEVQMGQLDEARKHICDAWDYLKENGCLGLENPGTVYRNCAEVFDALGETENVRLVLESGHQVLMEIADKINVPEWRQSFLENVPDNRAFMEMWERRKA